jgi:bacterioferritin (cytochrome b1)
MNVWFKERVMELQAQGMASSSLGNAQNWSIDPENDEHTQQLNSVLRGEIAAAESYAMAIDKMIEEGRDPAHISLIRALRQDHVQAAQEMRRRIIEMRGTPDESSGAWGTWAKLAMGTAQMFGDSAVLHTLKDGEAHGLKDLQEAIKSLDPQSAMRIESQLVPAQHRHIRQLEEIIKLLSS